MLTWVRVTAPRIVYLDLVARKYLSLDSRSITNESTEEGQSESKDVNCASEMASKRQLEEPDCVNRQQKSVPRVSQKRINLLSAIQSGGKRPEQSSDLISFRSIVTAGTIFQREHEQVSVSTWLSSEAYDAHDAPVRHGSRAQFPTHSKRTMRLLITVGSLKSTENTCLYPTPISTKYAKWRVRVTPLRLRTPVIGRS